jgi:hypothetical protein
MESTCASVGAYSVAVMVEQLLDDWYATGSTDWTENGLNIRTKDSGAFANVSPGNNNAFFTADVLNNNDAVSGGMPWDQTGVSRWCGSIGRQLSHTANG